MKYPKINSLYKRDRDHSLIIGDYSCPEFGNINNWLIQEKIDGTNIRIKYSKDLNGNTKLEIFGRNSDSLVPQAIIDHIIEKISVALMVSVFDIESGGSVWLFGEGYGRSIQSCGGNYREDVGFMLFDVVVNGWWLTQEDVGAMAVKLNIPYAPILAVANIHEIVDFVKSKPLSRCSRYPQMMEGIVARSEPLMRFRNGDPIMFKLKCKDM